MTVTIPEFVQAQSFIRAWWLPSIASSTGAPTVAEIEAGVDITRYLPEAWGGITGEQAKGQQDRMGVSDSIEVLGKVRRSIASVTPTFLPQGEPEDEGNELKTATAEGTRGHIAVRYGVDVDTAPTAGQKVDTIKAICGVQNKNTTAGDEFAPQTYTQEFGADGVLREDLAILAA